MQHLIHGYSRAIRKTKSSMLCFTKAKGGIHQPVYRLTCYKQHRLLYAPYNRCGDVSDSFDSSNNETPPPEDNSIMSLRGTALHELWI